MELPCSGHGNLSDTNSAHCGIERVGNLAYNSARRSSGYSGGLKIPNYRRGWTIEMATASAPLVTPPRYTYLNSSRGLKSWLLTQDHKRIAILYLLTTVFFFLIGGTAAGLIRLELLTPAGDLVSADTYNKLVSIHGISRGFCFLVPIAPAVFGNFPIPTTIGARAVPFPKITPLTYYLFLPGGRLELYLMPSG